MLYEFLDDDDDLIIIIMKIVRGVLKYKFVSLLQMCLCQQLCHCLAVSKASARHSAQCQPLPPLQLSAAPLLNVCLVSTDDRAESNQSLHSPLIAVRTSSGLNGAFLESSRTAHLMQMLPAAVETLRIHPSGLLG